MKIDSIAHVMSSRVENQFLLSKSIIEHVCDPKYSLKYKLCRWQCNSCYRKITLLASISNSLEMELQIKFISKTEYFQVYKQRDNTMFGNLFCEIELRSGVMF